jgi:hypothetical protein
MSVPSDAYAKGRCCGVCGELRDVGPHNPGWRVIRVDGVPVWECPECCRREPPDQAGMDTRNRRAGFRRMYHI